MLREDTDCDPRQSGKGWLGFKRRRQRTARHCLQRPGGDKTCVVYSQNISKISQIENPYISTLKKNTNISRKRKVFSVFRWIHD